LPAILVVAAALRLWAPWDAVFSGGVNFLETDAWYHVRLVENQVRNFPHRVALDPYAAPEGQYVAVAPLFGTIIATAVVATGGRQASTAEIERVAVFLPAVLGVLAVAMVWLLGTIAFDRRAGVLAGLLAAILPGHFLDRTLLGFVDHHALEVFLALATLAGLAWAIRTAQAWAAIAAGVCLGLYLLTWGSGAYFVAILGAWIVLAPLIGAPADAVAAAGRGEALAAATALGIVVGLQDPDLFRYNTQVASLAALLILSLLVMVFAGRLLWALGVIATTALMAAALSYMAAPDLVRQVVIDLARFHPDSTRMAVLEARPLFLYTGRWAWSQPWMFFGTGFYIGIVAVIALAARLLRSHRIDYLLIVVFTVANYASTLGQNRFGYYLVPATAVVGGWLGARVLDWGGIGRARGSPPSPAVRPWRRGAALLLIVGLGVAPNIVLAARTAARPGSMPAYWAAAMQWFRAMTPEPFDAPDYYHARYGPRPTRAAYTVMNWWDQGYWLIQAAHRVPVTNPTQGGAQTAAAFYTATDEAAGLEILGAVRARFVLVDWELPFREAGAGALAGRFQNLVDWAGTPASHFYSQCFSRARATDAWQPVWLFHEQYYQTMIYRLMVLGGAAASPTNNTWVVQVRQREDGAGRSFCEAAAAQRFASADEAKRAAAARGPGHQVVGLSAWQPAFPVPAVTGLRLAEEFRDPSQPAAQAAMVKVFEVVR
jgi:dolichyl-diphosphooligosaccharide--protein glycosyltransferase